MIQNLDLISPPAEAFSQYTVSISSDSTTAFHPHLDINHANLDSSIELYKKCPPHKNVDSNLQQNKVFESHPHIKSDGLEVLEKHILSEPNWDFLKIKQIPLNDNKHSTKAVSLKSQNLSTRWTDKDTHSESNNRFFKKISRNNSINSFSFPSLKRKIGYSNYNGAEYSEKNNIETVPKTTEESGKDHENNFISNNVVRFSIQPTSIRESNYEPVVTQQPDSCLIIRKNSVAKPESKYDLKNLEIPDQKTQNMSSEPSTSHILKKSASFRSLAASSKNGCISSIISARLNHEELPPETDDMIMENKVFNDMSSVERLTENIKVLSVDSDEETTTKTENSENMRFENLDDSNSGQMESEFNLDEWNHFLEDQWRIKEEILPEMFSINEKDLSILLNTPEEVASGKEELNDKENRSKTVKTRKTKGKKNLKNISSFIDLFSGYIKDDSLKIELSPKELYQGFNNDHSQKNNGQSDDNYTHRTNCKSKNKLTKRNRKQLSVLKVIKTPDETRVENKSSDGSFDFNEFPQMKIDPKFLNDESAIKPFLYEEFPNSSNELAKVIENKDLNNFSGNNEKSAMNVKKNLIRNYSKFFKSQRHNKTNDRDNLNRSQSWFGRINGSSSSISDKNDSISKNIDDGQRENTISFGLKSLFKGNGKSSRTVM